MTVTLLIPLALWLDSTALADHFAHGQAMANLLVWAVWLGTVRQATPRLRRLMVYCVPLSLLGELALTNVFHMYDYRLHAVPWYVPPGHSLVYASIFQLSRLRFVRVQSGRLVTGAWAASAGLAASWLVFKQDVAGFALFGAYSGLLAALRKRTFFVAMFFMVTYLELTGTALHCWGWSSTFMNRYALLPMANPPIGAPLLYVLLDLLCDSSYRASRAVPHTF